MRPNEKRPRPKTEGAAQNTNHHTRKEAGTTSALDSTSPEQVEPMPSAADLAAGAHRALEEGQCMHRDGVVLVPDVLLAEALANGFEFPETFRIIRDDGREVHMYQEVDR